MNLFDFLKNNNDAILLLITLISLFINLFTIISNNFTKRKKLSVKNINLIIKNFFTPLVLYRNYYENNFIFSKKYFRDFVASNLHLFNYNIRIIIIELLKSEYLLSKNKNKNKVLEDKYIETKKHLFKIVDTLYDNYFLLLEKEFTIKNIFWFIPNITVFLFIFSFIYLMSSFFFSILKSQEINISLQYKNEVFTFFNRYSLLIFTVISTVIFSSYRNFKSNFLYNNKHCYFTPKYLLKDTELYCSRCKKSFYGYRGLKFSCPANHKISYFKKKKELNIFQ